MTGALRLRHGATALFLLGLSSLPLAIPSSAQTSLETVKGLTCSFTVVVNGVWSAGVPKAEQRPPLQRPLVLKFEKIDLDGGTANATGAFRGVDLASPIIVSRFNGNLQFTQMLRSGPLYATTVFNEEVRPGKLKAIHSRHEVAEVAVPGFTSTPEQYYGDCEAVREPAK